MSSMRYLWPILLLSACVATPDGTSIPGSARSGDLVAYVGIVPAAVARARMAVDATPAHAPTVAGPDAHHLVVALFDAASGARIEQAGVVAIHRPPRGMAVERRLTPMRTGEVVSFGAEFAISRGAGHRFDVEVTRPDRPPVRFVFRYDNLH